MRTNFIKFLGLALFIGVFVITACKKTETTPDNDVQSATDDVYAQNKVSQVFTSVNNYGINDEGIKLREAWVTVEILNVTTGWPKKMKIDWDQCTDAAKKAGRTGIMYAEFSGAWQKIPTPNTNIKVSFDNYKVNGVKMEGTITLTYKGVNTDGGPSFGIKAENIKMTFANNEVIKWATDRTIDWTKGFDDMPLDLTKLEYKITGSNTGTNVKGVDYSAVIKEPLKITNCDVFPIVAGVLDITNAGSSINKSINFGDGTCDGKVSVTYGSLTVDVTLK